MRNKILLVDDDPGFQFIMKEYLEKIKSIRWFYFESDAQSALEFLEWRNLKNDFPNQIFLDLKMPGFSGFDFLEQYSKKYPVLFPSTKINIVTSSDLDLDREKTFAYPFVHAYITKPLTEENLKAVLK